ncbi:hypothetical protein SEUCBS139899_010061 [Sporothrix eucalyptigena]|uniref:Amino acid permease n=1 Tax=Sporothrix eucalyptigena TaxID=1812306 RepID=A0ABP0BC05_9PEZI
MANKNTASFVFTEVTNETGWDSNGVAWLVGLISAVYPFLGYDAACHLAEEVPHASRNVPLAMVGSVAMNGLIGLAYVIVLLFSTSSLSTLLETPTGFPFMQIYLDVTQSRAGALIMSLVPVLIATAANVAGLTSTSRTLYSFVRDSAVPFSSYLSHVDERTHVPARSVVLVGALQILLGFIYIGSETAFNAVLSMAIIGMYASYLLPIVVMLLHGRQKLSTSDYGPFRLGRPLGIVLNLISIAWMCLVIVFSTFPGSIPTTASTMNYSIVVMAGWLLFGFVYYLFSGRGKFQVPHFVTGSSNGVLTGVPVEVKASP